MYGICVSVYTYTHVCGCMCQSLLCIILVCAVVCTVGVGCYCVGDFGLCPSLSLAGLQTIYAHTYVHTYKEHTRFNEKRLFVVLLFRLYSFKLFVQVIELCNLHCVAFICFMCTLVCN